MVPQGSCGHRNVRPGGNQPTNGASFRLDHPTPCKNVRDLVKCGLWTPKRLRCGAGGHASARGATPRDKTRQRCTSAKTSPGALYKYQLGGAAGSYPFRAQEYDVEINLSALLSHFDAFPGTQETCRCAARRDTAEVQMAILRRSGYDTGHEAMLRCEGGGVTTERAGQNALDCCIWIPEDWNMHQASLSSNRHVRACVALRCVAWRCVALRACVRACVGDI